MKTLEEIRVAIDKLDSMLVDTLAERMKLVREVRAIKQSLGIATVQPHREVEICEKARKRALERGLDPDFVDQIMRMTMKHARVLQATMD